MEMINNRNNMINKSKKRKNEFEDKENIINVLSNM
jgi:hypothetical protein